MGGLPTVRQIPVADTVIDELQLRHETVCICRIPGLVFDSD